MAKNLGTLSITLVATTNKFLRGLKVAGDAIKKFAKSPSHEGLFCFNFAPVIKRLPVAKFVLCVIIK